MIEEVEVYDKYKIIIGTDENEIFVNKILRYDEPFVNNISQIEYGRVIVALFYKILELQEQLNKKEKR